jgi:hypothetical protein
LTDGRETNLWKQFFAKTHQKFANRNYKHIFQIFRCVAKNIFFG